MGVNMSIEKMVYSKALQPINRNMSGRQDLALIPINTGSIFAFVVFLILAPNRPETGLPQVNQKPMFTL